MKFENQMIMGAKLKEIKEILSSENDIAVILIAYLLGAKKLENRQITKADE